MNKVLFFILTYLISITAVFSAQEVQISTFEKFPPFVYRNSQGELTGIYIEIVKLALSRMPDYSVTFKETPWARAKMEAEKGKTFAILAPYFHAHDWRTKDEPKRPYLWPYSLSLFTQSDVLICNKEISLTSRTNFPEDFQGLNFVIWRGDGRAGTQFDEMVKNKRINLLLANGTQNVITNLFKKLADCAVTSQAAYAWHMNRMKESGKYHVYDDAGLTLNKSIIISTNNAFLGYSDINDETNYPFKKDFTIKFDIEIYKMKQNGEINKIAKRIINN